MSQNNDIKIPERFYCKYSDTGSIQEIICNPFCGGYIVAGKPTIKFQKEELQKLIKEGNLIIIDSEQDFLNQSK